MQLSWREQPVASSARFWMSRQATTVAHRSPIAGHRQATMMQPPQIMVTNLAWDRASSPPVPSEGEGCEAL